MAKKTGRSPGMEEQMSRAKGEWQGRANSFAGMMGDQRAEQKRMQEAMAGQRVGAPRTMPRAGVNTRAAAPRKNRRSAKRG